MHTFLILFKDDKVEVMSEGETREEVVVVMGRRLPVVLLPLLPPVVGVVD